MTTSESSPDSPASTGPGDQTTPPPTDVPPATDAVPSSAPSFTVLPVSPASTTPTGSAPGFAIDPASPSVVAAAADLATRLGVDPSAVSVVDAGAVTWGDSSLGCPEPGVQYLQVLQDGTLVILQAGGRRYEYHGGDPLFLCEDPKPPSGAD